MDPIRRRLDRDRPRRLVEVAPIVGDRCIFVSLVSHGRTGGGSFRETRRVLRLGGRLAFAVFTRPEENPWGALPAAVLVERGHMPPPESGAPGLFALADRSRLSQLLSQAGFSEPRFEDVAFTWRFADKDAFWTFLSEAAGAITIVLDRLDEHERLRVGQEIRERVEAFDGPNGIELQGMSLVASAT